MTMLNNFAQGCILFLFPFPSYSNLAQLLRELLQQGPDEDLEDQHWQGSQPAADWSWRGHRKFSLKNKGMSSNALRSMRRLWPSLLRSSDLSPTRYDEMIFLKVKVMELKIKTHNFVSIPRTNSGSSSLRTKVFQNPRMTFFQTMRKLRELDQAMEQLESRLMVSRSSLWTLELDH